ncbi:hypothetical protein BKK79_37875 (plasmid) [Cupriavidus sp. USMAA2-4]|jgi:hypothetical protein|nr:hypothetical protein BKK79_37875 [Cupriavidus sp. USMAA2-4]AOZ04277.1 hypothetical protein BKK81_33340 [Cupriavidus sp. USMAHM13]
MSPTTSLIARLSGVTLETAAAVRAAVLAELRDESPAPAEFAAGRPALCYALFSLAFSRPGLFWGAGLAVVAIPALLVLRWVR